MKYSTHILIIFLFLFSISGAAEGICQNVNSEITHVISVLHPGISAKDPVECNLIESKSPYASSSHFYMDVESVVCGSKECKIVTVRIHWNELGAYSKIELRNGADLEKNEGKPFSKTDYEKLESILKDKDSPLQTYYKYELVNNSHANALDAFSGATVEIDKTAIVEGAVWTCYTLWYWANGETVTEIREITAQKYSDEKLIALLKGSNSAYKKFAMEQLILRGNYSGEAQIAVLNASFESQLLGKKSIEYFEKSTSGVYYSSFEKMYLKGNLELRRALLNSMISTRLSVVKGVYEKVSEKNILSDSYQEIDLFFTLLDAKNYVSEIIIQNSLTLLTHENFIIARRAYWYLKKQDVTENQLHQISKFKNENSYRL